MVLRPIDRESEYKEYQVIGECYVHGLDDCVTLLGPLPSHVRVQLDKIPSGYSAVPTYLDLNTGVVSSADPRLQALGIAREWQKVSHQWNADDPALYEYYENIRSGDVCNSDPRLLPPALQSQGVCLRTFDLR